MGKMTNNPVEGFKDAVMGYTVLVLSLLVFIALLWIVVAVVRLMVG